MATPQKPRAVPNSGSPYFTVIASSATDLSAQLLPTPHVPDALRTGLTIDEVPEWLRLRFIQRGYRVGGDYRACLWSLFAWHNQTLNAWTMIAGSVVSTALLWWYTQDPRTDLTAVLLYAALWLSAVIHLPFSVGFHLFMPISPEVLHRWRNLDVCFIFVAAVLVTFAINFYVLPMWATAVLTFSSAVLSVYALHSVGKLKTGKSVNKKQNVSFIGLCTLLYTVPLLPDVWTAILQQNWSGSAASALQIQLALIVAASVYACSIPERYCASVFDIVGASQQLMHVAVIWGHAAQYAFVWYKCLEFQAAHDHAP